MHRLTDLITLCLKCLQKKEGKLKAKLPTDGKQNSFETALESVKFQRPSLHFDSEVFQIVNN